jgi:hypothetical protein
MGRNRYPKPRTVGDGFGSGGASAALAGQQAFGSGRNWGWQLVFAAMASLVFSTAGGVAYGKRNYFTDPRILLIRGLEATVAVAKVPLPAGKKGVVLNPQGKLEAVSAKAQLMSNGIVEITKIDFHRQRIVFEIDGGGKKWKWYRHIEIGMGGPGAMTPIGPQHVQQERYEGSSITLRLARKGVEPTVAQARQLLSSVLDFHHRTPTALYSESIPPQFRKAIKKHEVVVGMDEDDVFSAKGPPDRKVRSAKADSEEEDDWIYGLPPHCLYVVFMDGTVTEVHQY